MTGKKLLSDVILSLNSYLNFNDPDLIDLINIDENLEDGIKYLLSLNPPPNFGKFINALDKIREINKSNFLDTPYTLTGTISTIDFTQTKFLNRNRRFAYSNIEYGFVSTSAFFDETGLIDLSTEMNELIWKQLEEFLLLSYSSADLASVNQVFDIIKTVNKSIGLVINKTALLFDEDKQYPFIYLSFLNESNTLILENNLRYNRYNVYTPLVYNHRKDYEQFFDIYDVLNELNKSDDILNRFLRLYHIFEYLVYRVYLVNLVKRVGSSRIFVREFINSAESMKKGEKESFIKNFKIIFNNDLNANIKPGLNSLIVPAVTNFLSNKNIVKGFDLTQINKVAELIYGLRCCIVHNKESEYHISLSNSEDYKVIIPLLRKTIEIFESLVVKKISDNYREIKYTQKRIQLY